VRRPSIAKPTQTAVTGRFATLEQRLANALRLVSWFKSVPADWVSKVSSNGATGPAASTLQSKPCSDYRSLMMGWRKAMKWRQHMDDVMSVMLAVTASTVQQGDQLFLMVVGDPGGGKTRMCDGLLVSKHCHSLEYLTGFFSGIKGPNGEDYSLINRVNRKCMITPEGDIMMQNPNFLQIMSESRRIFDGTISASFKTQSEDKTYGGLRTPWIIAGTPAMLENDQANLGDRFLKVYLESPLQSERREILQRISRSALAAVQIQAEGQELVGGKLKEAYELTGGYVDWLRNNTNQLSEITVEEHYLEQCENLAEFAAFMRARPPREDDGVSTKEEPNRLGHQFVRLMCCLAFVLNKKAVDDDVMRRVRKVAMDTSRGIVLDITNILRMSQNQHASTKSLVIYTELPDAKVQKITRFLKRIGALRPSVEEGVKRGTKPLWGFTPLLKELVLATYDEIETNA